MDDDQAVAAIESLIWKCDAEKIALYRRRQFRSNCSRVTSLSLFNWCNVPKQLIGVGTPFEAMVKYRACLIDSDGHIEGFEPLVRADDEQAIGLAQRLARGCDVELWVGGLLVARIKKAPSGQSAD